MTLIRLQHAAFAAALAVQAGVLPSLAAGGEGEKPAPEKPAGAVEPLPLTSLFGTGSFFDVHRSLNDSFSSFMNLFAPMHSLMPTAGTSLSLSLPADEEDKRCYISVKMGKGVHADGVKVGLQTSGHRVVVAYSAQEMKEDSDPEKGSSRSTSSVQMTSSLGLPEKCMATTAVLLSSSGGYLLDSKNDGDREALIVFPSNALLSDYIEEKKLPENVVALLEAGDKQALDELPVLQRCMAAGFTEDDCGKLGGKPNVVSVASFEGAGNVVPIPRYDVSLDLLN
ncbi:hypothetical protein Emed_005056 [Eimeria media]